MKCIPSWMSCGVQLCFPLCSLWVLSVESSCLIVFVCVVVVDVSPVSCVRV